jgi:hypothetical protein
MIGVSLWGLLCGSSSSGKLFWQAFWAQQGDVCVLHAHEQIVHNLESTIQSVRQWLPRMLGNSRGLEGGEGGGLRNWSPQLRSSTVLRKIC